MRYAVDFAANHGDIEARDYQALVQAYGRRRARQIAALVNAIDFANVSGNTFDRLLERIIHKKAAQDLSSSLAEILVGVAAAPILLPVLGTLMQSSYSKVLAKSASLVHKNT